jgi:hypothetical protein
MNANETRDKELGASFRQSRCETLVILAGWIVLLLWTGLACGIGSRLDPEEPVATLLGMPRWVFLGVILPWLAACGFTFWFALCFMADTDLDPDRERSEEAE